MKDLDKKDGFPKDSFVTLASLEDKNWWFISRNKILEWLLLKRVKEFDKFLEIGCGTGFVLNHLSTRFPKAQFFGSELHKEGLDIAKERNKEAHFFNLNAVHMNERESYNVIGAFDVLEHIKEDEVVIANLFRAIKIKGYLIITVPQHPFLWSTLDQQSFHCRRYTRNEIMGKLTKCGFKIQYASSFVSLLLPLMFLSRKFQKRSRYDIASELKISPLVNFLLKQVMNFEILLLQIGIRWLAGGSLLILAQKT